MYNYGVFLWELLPYLFSVERRGPQGHFHHGRLEFSISARERIFHISLPLSAGMT